MSPQISEFVPALGAQGRGGRCALVNTVPTGRQLVGALHLPIAKKTAGSASGLRIAKVTGMAQKTVQLVIGWLLTDEDLRASFLERPRETLTELRNRGYELTFEEIDALARSDASAWRSMAQRIHPRLQRCSLRLRS